MGSSSSEGFQQIHGVLRVTSEWITFSKDLSPTASWPISQTMTPPSF